MDDVVDARLTAGGHASPGNVLLWLQGDASPPWMDDEDIGDDGVLEELGRRIRDPR